MFGGLLYLDAFPYEQFNTTIKEFIRMISMRKTCSMNKAVIAMNVISPLEKKLCNSLLEKRRCVMSRYETKLTLHRVVSTANTLIEHVRSNGRAALRIFIIETIKEALPANRTTPFPAQIICNIVRSRLIHGDSNVTFKHYNTETESIAKNRD